MKKEEQQQAPPSVVPPLDVAADRHLQETGIAAERAWHGRLLDVRRDTVRLPDGRQATREYIAHSGAVAVVPVLDDGRVVVVRQYRYPVGRAMLELPAGKIDPGEPPFDCAVRELAEETGYRAREWAHAGVLHNAIAYSTEKIEIWFARGLQAGSAQLDEGEFLDVEALTVAELNALAGRGELTDAKTLIGLLWLERALGAGGDAAAWPLDWHPAHG
jgi:ADP-ribose pyrophosphatase